VTDARKYRVLVVDDESSVLTTYRLILEQQGYLVTACSTSRDAIAAIEKQDFDVVLCDYSLEEQHTGFEVISTARARVPNLPAALLTGYATKETADEAEKQNIGIMFKPIEIEEFLATTAQMLRKNNESSIKENSGQEASRPQTGGKAREQRGSSTRRRSAGSGTSKA
jgi:two-component system response regulator HydG